MNNLFSIVEQKSNSWQVRVYSVDLTSSSHRVARVAYLGVFIVQAA